MYLEEEDEFERREAEFVDAPSSLAFGLSLKTKPNDNIVLTRALFLEIQNLFTIHGKAYFAIKFSLLSGNIEPSEDFRFVEDPEDKSKNPLTNFMKEWKDLDITKVSLG
jgi:hypothetical protein